MDINEILEPGESMNKRTGEIIPEGKLNEVIVIRTQRENGSWDIAQDFSNCPSMAEQHTAHLTDVNYLMAKYTPDELSQFIAARAQYRQEIIGHDFSKEPSLQEAKNHVYNARKIFESMDETIQNQFKSPLEFFKFIDNPANAEKMVKLGLVKANEIKSLNSTPPELKNNELNNDKKTPEASKS